MLSRTGKTVWKRFVSKGDIGCKLWNLNMCMLRQCAVKIFYRENIMLHHKQWVLWPPQRMDRRRTENKIRRVYGNTLMFVAVKFATLNFSPSLSFDQQKIEFGACRLVTVIFIIFSFLCHLFSVRFSCHYRSTANLTLFSPAIFFKDCFLVSVKILSHSSLK